MELTDLIDSLGAYGLPVTIFLALAGYIFNLVTTQLELRAESRQARVEREFKYVSAQLEQLYGPLYAMVEANTAAWEVYRKSFRPGQSLNYSEFTADEKKVWRLWAEHVFIPGNRRIRQVIEQHSQLLVERELPPILISLLRHLESSNLVLPLTQDLDDISAIQQFEPWPAELRDYITKMYRQVAEEHAELLGRVRSGNGK